MEFEEFQSCCNSKKCLKRSRWDFKTCIRVSKQMNCHKSYERLELKRQDKFEQKKQDWSEIADFNDEIWIRDTGSSRPENSVLKNWKQFCRIWKILSLDEKLYLEKNDTDLEINQMLDLAHIDSRTMNSAKIKDTENVLLIGRIFHRRLTDCKHPVYNTNITKEEVNYWMICAQHKKR